MSDRTGTAQPFVRRRKWIRPDVQLKVVLRTMFVAILVLLINFQLSLIGYWLLVQQGPGTDPISRMPGMLLRYFLVSLGIAIPLSVSVSILFSFKFCGPIFRFSRFLHDAVDGRWDKRCGLRLGDDLHDVKDVLNTAVDAFANRVRSQHEVLRDAAALLRAEGDSPANAEKVEELLARIDAEAKEFDRRFPEAKHPGKSAPPPLRDGEPVSAEREEAGARTQPTTA